MPMMEKRSSPKPSLSSSQAGAFDAMGADRLAQKKYPPPAAMTIQQGGDRQKECRQP
jgi:hypothetical protein